MTIVGIIINHFDKLDISTDFTKYIQSMAVGFVAYAAFKISSKVVKTHEAVSIAIVSSILSFMLKSPILFPFLLIGAGAITAIKFKEQPIEEKVPLKINWSNFILWIGMFAVIALLGHYTQYRPLRLLENFYRNGSMIFGGGQILIPLLYTEFVEFKHYLTSAEFLTGFAIVQTVPGPTFSFTSYVGALSMRGYGMGGQVLGAFLATIGIFLPGTFMIFFVIPFWDQLKRYQIVRASLEGISAASAGMVVAAAFLLFQPLEADFINLFIIVGTFILLMFTKLPAPFIILAGLVAGLII